MQSSRPERSDVILVTTRADVGSPASVRDLISAALTGDLEHKKLVNCEKSGCFRERTAHARDSITVFNLQNATS